MQLTKIVRAAVLVAATVFGPASAQLFTNPKPLFDAFAQIETAAKEVGTCAQNFNGGFLQAASCANAVYRGQSAGANAIKVLGETNLNAMLPTDLLLFVAAYGKGTAEVTAALGVVVSRAAVLKQLNMGFVVAMFLGGYEGQRAALGNLALEKSPLLIRPAIRASSEKVGEGFQTAIELFKS